MPSEQIGCVPGTQNKCLRCPQSPACVSVSLCWSRLWADGVTHVISLCAPYFTLIFAQMPTVTSSFSADWRDSPALFSLCVPSPAFFPTIALINYYWQSHIICCTWHLIDNILPVSFICLSPFLPCSSTKYANSARTGSLVFFIHCSVSVPRIMSERCSDIYETVGWVSDCIWPSLHPPRES